MPHMLVAINWLIAKEVCIERQSKKIKNKNLIVASSAISLGILSLLLIFSYCKSLVVEITRLTQLSKVVCQVFVTMKYLLTCDVNLISFSTSDGHHCDKTQHLNF